MSPKLKKLKSILLDMKSAVIAYSGGVDSTFLAKVAYDTLKDKAVAVTAVSEVYPPKDLAMAKKAAKTIGIRHLIIKTDEMQNKDFTGNSRLRCYYCKQELAGVLLEIAAREKTKHLLFGNNKDDENDYRPGMKAIKESGGRNPLIEAGLSKKEIRAISKEYNLPTADLPASPCLASRFPYGQKITGDSLSRVSSAEEYLRRLGLREFRVRHHGDTARIETHKADMKLLLEKSQGIVSHFKKKGYKYVSLDLEGYRMGSLNEAIRKK